MSIEYKGFIITTNRIYEMEQLKKTVDDYEADFKQTPMDVDAARVEMARRSACQLLVPMSADQTKLMGLLGLGTPIAGAVTPTRIGLKHCTKSSRVRNLVHGGMLGLLSVRLMSDSSQTKRRSRTFQSLSVIRRANNQAGCLHVRWSIPEFQRRYNMNVKGFGTEGIENPFVMLNISDAIAKFALINTAENRAQFLAECAAHADEPTHSRIVASTCHVSDNTWITNFMFGFQKICSYHMSQVTDASLRKLQRSVNLVQLYRFMISSVGWIFDDPLMQFIVSSITRKGSMNRLFEKYADRLIYMSHEGVEHAACLMGHHFPELMTPELHVRVDPTTDLYRAPQLEIGEDDALFGPLKSTFQALLPDAVPMPAPTQLHRNRIYSDSEDDDYYHDYHDNNDSDDDNYSDDDDDNAQG